jgi:hypothetical protein
MPNGNNEGLKNRLAEKCFPTFTMIVGTQVHAYIPDSQGIIHRRIVGRGEINVPFNVRHCPPTETGSDIQRPSVS